MGASYKNNYQQYEYVPFPEIGCGSQFRVFDTHDGRVLKMPLTRWRAKHQCSDCSDEAITIAAFVSTKVAEIDYIDRL